MTAKHYIGTKRVTGTPMNRADYNVYRGWQLPADENGADEGYLVEYVDGGKANDSRHAGYISWSPKDVFERAYKEVPPTLPGATAAFQGRVVAEKADLDEKLGKLLSFFQGPVFHTLPEAEQSRLRNQARFMEGYSAVLGERIEAFTTAKD